MRTTVLHLLRLLAAVPAGLAVFSLARPAAAQQKVAVEWAMERLHAANITDQTSSKDEVVIEVVQDGKPTKQYPGNKRGYYQLAKGENVARTVLFRDSLAPGEERRFVVNFREVDDDAPLIAAVFNAAATAVQNDTTWGWSAPLLRAVGSVAGANSDDLLGVQLVRLKNEGGKIVPRVHYLVESPTNLDIDRIERGVEPGRKGLDGRFEAHFHRKGKWAYVLWTGAETNGQLVAMSQQEYRNMRASAAASKITAKRQPRPKGAARSKTDR